MTDDYTVERDGGSQPCSGSWLQCMPLRPCFFPSVSPNLGGCSSCHSVAVVLSLSHFCVIGPPCVPCAVTAAVQSWLP